MSLLSVPFSFSAGAQIKAAEFNSNYSAIINALSGIVDTIEFILAFNGATPVLILNQKGAGSVLKLQQNGVDKIEINNTGQLDSKLSIGTAPFIVASTTKVANLNADQLDGLHDTAFLKLTGGTLTGFLTLNAAPTADLHSSTKKYVDDSITAIPGAFPSGTKLLFGTNPPTGWTRVNETEDILTRLAKSGDTLGTVGGSWLVSGLTTNASITENHTLTTSQIPAHSHSVASAINGSMFCSVTAGSTHAAPATGSGMAFINNTDNTGSGTGHSHSLPNIGITSDTTWRPRFKIWAGATKN